MCNGWSLNLLATWLWIRSSVSDSIMDLGPHSPKVPVMQLRSLGQPLIKYIIGNGLHTFSWLDNWHPLGPLYDKFGESVVYDLGRSLSSKVSTIIQNEDWKWPRQRNRITQSIMAHTPSDFKPDCGKEDSVVWLPIHKGFLWNLLGKQLEVEDLSNSGLKWFGLVKIFLVGPLFCGWLFNRSWTLGMDFFLGAWLWMAVVLSVILAKNLITTFSSSAHCPFLCGVKFGGGHQLIISLLH